MIIVLGMSKQEDFGRPEKPLEKTREIDNEARISKKAEMKRKFNRNQKRITLWDIQLSSLTSLISKIMLLRHILTQTTVLQKALYIANEMSQNLSKSFIVNEMSQNLSKSLIMLFISKWWRHVIQPCSVW